MDFDEYDYLEKAVEPPVPSTNGAGEKDRSSRRRSSAGGGRDLEERGSKRPRSGEDRERHRSGREHRDREDGKVSMKDEGRDREKVREKDGGRSREKVREKDESRDPEKIREKDASRDREKVREKDGSRDREKVWEKEREGRDRLMERELGRERRSRSRSERRRGEEEEMVRELQRERDRSDRHRDYRDRDFRRKKDDGTEPEVDPERDQRTVFAFQLSLKADERDVYEFFSRAGKVRDVRLIMDRNSRRSKGVGYIEFYDVMSVPMAIALTGQPLLGQGVMVKPSEAEKNLAQSNATSGGAASGGARKLYVGNLHSNITEDQLRQVFEPFGQVELVQLPVDPLTGLCKGFGFIQFARLEDAKAAQSLNGQLDIAGRVIKVSAVTDQGGMQLGGTTTGDLDDDEGGGLALNASSRALLMRKLDRSGSTTSLTGGIVAPGLNTSVGLPAASMFGAPMAAASLIQPVGVVSGAPLLPIISQSADIGMPTDARPPADTQERFVRHAPPRSPTPRGQQIRAAAAPSARSPARIPEMAGMEAFEAYFRRADLNQDGRISGQEAVAFFQGAGLPQQVLAQVWMHADKNKTGFLGRPEFFNALRLVTVAQSGRQLTPDIVQSALLGPAAARIPPPKMAAVGPSPPQPGAAGAPRPQGNAATTPAPGPAQMNLAAAPRPQGSGMMPTATQIGGAPQVNAGAVPRPQGINSMMPAANQGGGAMPPNQFAGPRGTQSQPPNMGFNQQLPPSSTGFMRPPQAGAPPTSLQTTGMNQSPLGGGSMGGSLQATGMYQSPLGGGSMGGSVGWQGGNAGGFSQPSPGPAVPPQTTSGGFGLGMSRPMGGLASGLLAQAMSSSSLPPQSNSAVLPQDSRALVLSGNGPASSSGPSTDIFSALTQPKPSTSTPALPTSTMPNSSSFMSTPTASQNFANLTQPGSLHGTPTMSYGGSQSQQTLPPAKPSVPAPGVSAGVSNSTSQWPKVNQSDIQKYTKVFGDVDKDRDGKITGAEARTLFLSWRLSRDVLKQVWDLSDQDNDGMLSLREFCIALYLMERHRAGTPLPPSLPDSLKFDETLLRATGLPSTAYSAPSWQQNQGLPNRGPATPGLPTGGIRPPLPQPSHPQTDGATRQAQPRSYMPGMDNHVAPQGSKDDISGVNSTAQEVANAPKKVEVEKQILDSREKLEYYRTKMQDLVLYKSRCDNRLNEITERASSDKREVELLSKKYEEKYKQVAELASKLAVDEAAFRDVQERKVELNEALVKMVQGGSVDGLLQVRADRIQHQLEEMEKAFSERCKHFGLQFKPSASVELPFGWEPGQQEGALEWDEDWDKFEDEGFGLVKDNGTIVENPASENAKSSSLWDDGVMDSPVASSNGHAKDFNHYRAGDQVPESELVYDFGDESVRSPGSAGRSASGSPFKSSRFGHDSSPTKKGTYSDHGGSESVFGDNYADETSWNFDEQDTESVWGSNANEAGNHGSNSFFGSDDFGGNSVRVSSPTGPSVYGKKSSFFDESVPSSPAYTSGFSPKFGESRDGSSSYNFGRFDSFASQDSVVPHEQSRFSRFDSISSSAGENTAGFDSSNSSRNFGRFDSFDEADPFGSTGPFKASGARSPPKF